MTQPEAPGAPFAGRAGSGLYLLAWLLTGVGVALLLAGASGATGLRGVLLTGGLGALLLGLVTGAGYQIISRRLRPSPRFRGPSPVLLFLIQLIGVNLASIALLPLGITQPDTPPAFLLAAIVLLVGYVLVVYVFGIRSGALDREDLGLPARPRLGRLLTDIAAGAGTMIAVAFVAGLLGGLLARLLGTEAPEIVPLARSGTDLAMVALSAGILVPIGEELFFRGYTLTAWLRDKGPRTALVWSTVFFALVHIVSITSPTFDEGVRQAALVVAVIGPVGLALGWLFLRRGLIAAIAGHAGFNLFGILINVLVQDLPPLPPG